MTVGTNVVAKIAIQTLQLMVRWVHGIIGQQQYDPTSNTACSWGMQGTKHGACERQNMLQGTASWQKMISLCTDSSPFSAMAARYGLVGKTRSQTSP